MMKKLTSAALLSLALLLSACDKPGESTPADTSAEATDSTAISSDSGTEESSIEEETSAQKVKNLFTTLATTNNGTVMLCDFFGFIGIHFVWKSAEGSHTYWDKEVVAWMPMPKPYREGQGWRNAMSELISRSAILKHIEKTRHDAQMMDDIHRASIVMNGMSLGEEAVMNQPSVHPEQKVGKWIIKNNPGSGWYRVTCSECGEDVTSEIRLIGFIPNCKALWDFCPYCGTRMEGVECDEEFD